MPPSALADRLHDLHGALPAEHQQAGGDAAHELRHLVESLRFCRRAECLRYGLLDPRHVDDAFAEHRVLYLPELLVLRRGVGSRPRLRQDQPHELRVEAVLDLDQGSGDAEQRRVVGRRPAVDDRAQRLDLALHAVAQGPQAQHAERVADLAQHLELRDEVLDLVGALADEDIQHVLDAGQVFANRRGNRPHQAHRGCR